MNKKWKIIILTLIIIVVSTIGIAIWKNNKNFNKIEDNSQIEKKEENVEISENQEKDSNENSSKIDEISETEKEQIIDEIKEDLGATGDSDLYEIKEGYDNQKTISIKSSVKYKVAFAGMIKNGEIDKNGLDEIMQKSHPQKAGIWIYEKDRKKFLELLKNITQSEYEITTDGYLKILDNKKANENDKKIEKIINGEKLVIIRISSICYIIDDITGEILDYNFEQIDQYQTYEYFKDEDKIIIFITQNKEKQLQEKEIIQSVIDLI